MGHPDTAADVFERNFKQKILSGPDVEYWPKQRVRAIIRDGEECDICKMGRKKHRDVYGSDLHVHHITPRKEVPDDINEHRLDNLRTLCAKCHRKVESEHQSTD
jgi:5-methylcytosine-specific restriction endonuclease McrA